MRTNISRVLCAIDYSEFSRHVLDHAAAVARGYEAELSVLHVLGLVIPATVVAPAAATVPIAPQADSAEAEAQLREFVKPIENSGTRVKPVVISGPVVAGIIDVATTSGADLIVVGTHGRSGFERLFLGSTAERVLRKARCPVLTVPPRVEAPPAAEVLFTRILCPIDFSDASLGALEYALSLARASDARLTLLHALELFEEGPSVPAYDLSEFHRLRQQEAERALVRLVPEDAGEWCRPQTIVANGSAYRAILRLAEEEGTDLIVIGVHGRNPVERLILGSTTERVVRGAPCPVLTIRPLEA